MTDVIATEAGRRPKNHHTTDRQTDNQKPNHVNPVQIYDFLVLRIRNKSQTRAQFWCHEQLNRISKINWHSVELHRRASDCVLKSLKYGYGKNAHTNWINWAETNEKSSVFREVNENFILLELLHVERARATQGLPIITERK